MTDAKIHPVVLCGGAGSRLWPMSRTHLPKQLLPLTSSRSLLQETVGRVTNPVFAPVTLISNGEHRYLIADQLRQMNVSPRAFVLEPEGRNTAPAAIIAAALLARDDPHAIMLLLPSDHLIRDNAAFRQAVLRGAAAAAGGALVTFGVHPDRPHTGYGYIKRGQALAALQGCFGVERFVEKPDAATAENFLGAGDYLWNSGIFMFEAGRFLAEAERLEPEMRQCCQRAVDGATCDGIYVRLPEEEFRKAPAKSIDYAVMEHTAEAAVIPVEMEWSDVGSWSALWEVAEKDQLGNVLVGDAMVQDAHGCYVRSEGMLTTVVGIDDAIVVVTEDAALVVSKDRAQDVRAIVDRLKLAGRTEHENSKVVRRPWGNFTGIDLGDGYQVKKILVNPGAKLSLQLHYQRAEHWIVVRGTARVTRQEDIFLLGKNESTYIPLGVWHRLENVGKTPLVIIEVQTGDYLGEDDIVRSEDVYGRVTPPVGA